MRLIGNLRFIAPPNRVGANRALPLRILCSSNLKLAARLILVTTRHTLYLVTLDANDAYRLTGSVDIERSYTRALRGDEELCKQKVLVRIR